MEAALAAKAGTAIPVGMAGFAEARAEKRSAETNAYIGRTRAMQTDTDARAGLSSEFANMRAVMGSNGQAPNVGTFEMFNELRAVRDRERRINMSNRMQEVGDFQTAAGNAQTAGNFALVSGFGRSASSLFDLYQLQ